jgi:hypothetical protein
MFIIRETNWSTLKHKFTKIMQLLGRKGRIRSWIRIRNDPTPGQKVPIRPDLDQRTGYCFLTQAAPAASAGRSQRD